MASTNFSYGTLITSIWLNEVNNAVFNTVPSLAPKVNPTFTTPNIGVATATSVNKVGLYTPGSGATITVSADATISGTNTGDQLTFKTLAVTGQSSVVADILTDTLTFAASGMTITTNPATKTVTFAAGAANLVRTARTSNTMLVKADQATYIDITSGTFTQTFDTVSNLGNGWYIYIRNSGTGDITIPVSDGVTNWIMYPGEFRLFQCDGTSLYSTVIQPFYKVATTSGNFIKPPGYNRFHGEMWAGGASGGRYTGAGVIVYSGGGGAYLPFGFAASSLAASEAFVIGAGGAAVTVSNTQTGNAGGNTTFKGLTAYGGTSTNSGGIGGSAYISGILWSQNSTIGSADGNSISNITLYGGASNATAGNGAGKTIFGGGAGAGINGSDALFTGGTSVFGGAGGATDGASGTAPGGGGSAARSSAQSGAGARGEFRIWGVV